MNFQRPSGGASDQRDGGTMLQVRTDSEEDPAGVCGEKELLLLHAFAMQFKNDCFSYNGYQMTVWDLIIAIRLWWFLYLLPIKSSCLSILMFAIIS